METNPNQNKQENKQKPKLVKKSEQIKFEPERIHPEELNYTFERTQLWDPTPEGVNLAYSKYAELWNKDQKSRNFVKHLTANFLPIQQFNRAVNLKPNTKCAILDYELAGIFEISKVHGELGVKRMFINSMNYLELDKFKEENPDKSTEEFKASKELQTRIDEYNDILEKMEPKFKFARVGYLSDNSDKILSQDAVIGLLKFVENMLWISDELSFTINKRRLKEMAENMPNSKPKFSQKEINQTSKAMTFGDAVSPELLAKLREACETTDNK